MPGGGPRCPHSIGRCVHAARRLALSRTPGARRTVRAGAGEGAARGPRRARGLKQGAPCMSKPIRLGGGWAENVRRGRLTGDRSGARPAARGQGSGIRIHRCGVRLLARGNAPSAEWNEEICSTSTSRAPGVSHNVSMLSDGIPSGPLFRRRACVSPPTRYRGSVRSPAPSCPRPEV
eukprot:scaffold966_cov415-Prasinococcus_capsulatus_cf.AAC.2